MKHKFMFGLQVFTTLILFMAIFVTYLEIGEVKQTEKQEKNETISTGIGSNKTIVDLISGSFTTSISGVISCGK
jgi:hypothetical protein